MGVLIFDLRRSLIFATNTDQRWVTLFTVTDNQIGEKLRPPPGEWPTQSASNFAYYMAKVED